MKRQLSVWSVAVVTVMMLTLVVSPMASAVNWMSLATAGTGGAWYPIGGGIADLVNKKADGIRMSAEVTAGGVENVRLVDRNEVQFGFANYDAAYFGYHGEGPYDGKKNILGLFTLYPSSLQMAVLAGSDIYSIEDLRGKRVVVGPPASSSAIMGWNVLAAYGIGKDEIKGLTVSFSEGAQYLKDGNADAVFVMSAHPNSALLDLSTVRDIRLLSISPEKQAEINDNYGYYGKFTIPANVYKGQTEPVTTMSLATMVIANADVDEDLVYTFTKTIFDNLDTVRGFHAIARNISLENGVNIPIPMHPGAARYFKEKGLL